MTNSFTEFTFDQLKHDLDATRLRLAHATVSSNVNVRGNSCQSKLLRRQIARILTEINARHRRPASHPIVF